MFGRILSNSFRSKHRQGHVLFTVVFLTLLSSQALANRCASIHSWTGCYLDDQAEGCDSKVVKIDFTNLEGETQSQWIAKTDIRHNTELKTHIIGIMQNFTTVNSYLDAHCSDGPCLTGHDYLCEDG